MYSVEWIPKAYLEYPGPHAWNQWTLTRSHWIAKWAVWDFKHTLNRKQREFYETRIREV